MPRPTGLQRILVHAMSVAGWVSLPVSWLAVQMWWTETFAFWYLLPLTITFSTLPGSFVLRERLFGTPVFSRQNAIRVAIWLVVLSVATTALLLLALSVLVKVLVDSGLLDFVRID